MTAPPTDDEPGGRTELCLVCGRRFPESEGRCQVCIKQVSRATLNDLRARPGWRILVTGSRDWTDTQTVLDALDYHTLASDTLVVGDCPTGADRIATDRWREFGGHLEVHRADWSRWGRAAGPRRNLDMVRSGADVCLVFIRGGSRGASHCANEAEKAKILVYRWYV